MIDDAEIRRRASSLGVQQDHVERDYVLNHILAHVSADPGTLIFRGGTALARVFWPDFRLSEDLDFIAPGRGEDIEGIERRAVRRAQETTGIELSLDFGTPRGDRSRSIVDWTTDWGSAGSLLIDVVRGEEPALPKEDRELNLPYSDLADGHALPVLPLADILGSKWGMLDDRDEPRDLFDVWFALTQALVPFEALALGYRARYGHDPIPAFLKRAERLRRSWQERLIHQMKNLPDFDEVLGSVRAIVQDWESDRR
jgi:predicted nucleotidyltransferase component of viral defense system